MIILKLYIKTYTGAGNFNYNLFKQIRHKNKNLKLDQFQQNLEQKQQEFNSMMKKENLKM